MPKLTLSDLANITGNEQSAITTINNNNAAIETALENTLSRDGTTPNSMSADLDMDGNDIINVGSLTMDSEVVLASVTPYIETLLDDETAGEAQTTLGISSYIKTLLDDTDASTAQTTLGFTAFAKTLLDDTTATQAQATLGVREVLTANRTYYVRTDGSDSNTGLADTAGGAFLTLQKAYDVIADTLDLSDHVVTIQVADGTYTRPLGSDYILFISRPWVGGKGVGGVGQVGGGAVQIIGNRTTPANCILSIASTGSALVNRGIFVNCGLPGVLDIAGFRFIDSVGGGVGLMNNGAGSMINIADVDFATVGTTGYHMWAAQSGVIFCYDDNYSISGPASHHALVEVGGAIDLELGTITITGTPAFTTSFIRVESTGVFYCAANFSGSATGKRFIARSSGGIQLYTDTFGDLGATALTTLPGDVEGEFQGGTLNGYGGALGLRVGFSGHPTANKIEVGDSEFSLLFSGGGPLIVLDANDYLAYDRTGNSFVFHTGNADTIIIDGNGGVTQRHATGGIGYGAGSGGTVTQLVSKATTVVLNRSTGQITTHNAVLNANTTVSFTLTNSAIASTDHIIIEHVSGGTLFSYAVKAVAASGSATVSLRNITAGNLTEALVLKFVVIKASIT